MEVLFSRQAAKILQRLDISTKKRIVKGINEIPEGDIKKLKEHKHLYRLRIGGWRISFSYPDKETVLIVEIKPRGDAY